MGVKIIHCKFAYQKLIDIKGSFIVKGKEEKYT